MNSDPPPSSPARHKGPPLGIVALIFVALFCAGLSFVGALRGSSLRFPGPFAPAEVITAYFRQHADAAAACAFLHFGSSIALGVFTAAAFSRLRFLGVRAAGSVIALFGGVAAALNIAASAIVLWTMTYPGIASDQVVLQALYYLQFGFGGVGFSVPIGLLIAGISVPAVFLRLLPRWAIVAGLLIAACGELSSLDILFPRLLFLIPLTRFPAFVWLIIAGFQLPVSAKRQSGLDK